jgi:hypothetical protein
MNISLRIKIKPNRLVASCSTAIDYTHKPRRSQIGVRFTSDLYVPGSSSVVSIATRYGQDGPGIEIRWGRDFRTRPVCIEFISRRQSGRGTHPNLVPKLKKEYSYTSTPYLGLHSLF